jgi:hypothetical protein
MTEDPFGGEQVGQLVRFIRIASSCEGTMGSARLQERGQP